MIIVRSIHIDRRRSGIADLSNPLSSEWRIVYRLQPTPPKAWDHQFNLALRDATVAGELRFQHALMRETPNNSYFYRRSRWAAVKRFLRGLLNLNTVSVIVTCPPSAEGLNEATAEFTRLVARANVALASALQNFDDLAVAESVAQKRLAHAIRETDRYLARKKINVVMSDYPMTDSEKFSRS